MISKKSFFLALMFIVTSVSINAQTLDEELFEIFDDSNSKLFSSLHEEAVKANFQVIEMSKNAVLSDFFTARAYLGLSHKFGIIDEFEQSLKYARLALKHSLEGKYEVGIATANLNMGFAYLEMLI